jgi:hypothetical protein
MPIGLDSPPDIKGWEWSYGDCPVSEIDWEGIHKLSMERTKNMEKANKLLDYLDEIHELAEQLGLRPSEVLL